MFPMAEPYVPSRKPYVSATGNVSFCFGKHKMPFGLCRFMQAGFVFILFHSGDVCCFGYCAQKHVTFVRSICVSVRGITAVS